MKIRSPQSQSSCNILQVYHNGTFGVISGNIRFTGWNINNGKVACVQLGYRTVQNSCRKFVEHQITFEWIDNMECNGSEKNILECRNVKFTGKISTASKYYAGVICTGNIYDVCKYWPNIYCISQ